MSERLGKRAIVAGAGISGLLAARVLANGYEQVILLERDTFPRLSEHRRGVPQGRHTHALLPRGHEVLEALFPGLTARLIDRGAVAYDQLQDMRRFVGGGYYWRGVSGLPSLMASRPLLEAEIRARVLERRNVDAIEHCDVLGLVSTTDGARVTGVRLIRSQPGSAEELWPADLVVDATGRGSRMPAWLQTLGYDAPEEERVEIGVGYATRLFRRKPGQLSGDLGALVMPTPTCRRVGVVIAQEAMRWSVTLIGYQGDAPPTDGQGFLEFARSLPAPDIRDLIRSAEPLGEAVRARMPFNVRRHYERLARFPEGLIVTGDALCSLNPTYSQGMTVAALEALALRESLHHGADGLAARFFAMAAAAVDPIWGITVSSDLSLISPDAPRSAPRRLFERYLARLHAAARHDPVAAIAFVRATGLLERPSSLLHPRVAARVLWSPLRSARRAASRPSGHTDGADPISGAASARTTRLLPFTPKG